MNKLSQTDHVMEEVGYKPTHRVERVAFPGIKQLHEKPTAEIAEALAMALKSHSNVVELRYCVGQFIELTVNQP